MSSTTSKHAAGRDWIAWGWLTASSCFLRTSRETSSGIKDQSAPSKHQQPQKNSDLSAFSAFLAKLTEAMALLA
jgi:hypothetical protein